MSVRGYVDSRWGQVHHRSHGDGEDVVVLLHESPLSSAVYEPVLPLLGRAVRAIAFDTPGYGLSDPPPGEREIPDYAAALLEAVDGLGVGRFAVAGVHTGASLAVQMALQAGPGRVSHVVASGVPLLSAEERAEYLRSWSPPMAPAADGSHLRWAWERYERIWQGPPELLHLGATLLLGNLERYHWAYNAAFRHDPRPDLGRLSCPVLFLTAEHDLLIRSDREALALVPGSRLVEVPGLAGQLPLRAPEAFADALLAFVREPSGQS